MITQYKTFEQNKINFYYNSHGETMTWNDFKEIEVEERGNYDEEDILKLENKYDIKSDDDGIWVTKDKKDCLKYVLPSSYYDDIENSDNVQDLDSILRDNDINDIDDIIHTYSSYDGFILNETDDGDNGYLFIFYK